MTPSIPGPPRRSPPLQHPLPLHQLKNLHFDLSTTLLHAPLLFLALALALAPQPKSPPTQIPAWTRTDRAQQIDLGEKVDVIARARRARLHEVAAAGVEASDLEQVEHVVDVWFGQVEGEDGAHEVGVTVGVELGALGGVEGVGVRLVIGAAAAATEQGIDVRIAAGAEQVVHAAAVRGAKNAVHVHPTIPIPTAPRLQAVGDDGHHRPQVRQTAPQPVAHRDVAGVQLARAGGPEALARIVRRPEVEVGDLGAARGGEAQDLAGGDAPGVAGARRERVGVGEGAGGGGEAGVEGWVDQEGRGGGGGEVGGLRLRLRLRLALRRGGRRRTVGGHDSSERVSNSNLCGISHGHVMEVMLVQLAVRLPRVEMRTLSEVLVDWEN